MDFDLVSKALLGIIHKIHDEEIGEAAVDNCSNSRITWTCFRILCPLFEWV